MSWIKAVPVKKESNEIMYKMAEILLKKMQKKGKKSVI